MDLREIGLGGCGLDSTISGQGPVAGCCECGDELSGSCATELVFLVSCQGEEGRQICDCKTIAHSCASVWKRIETKCAFGWAYVSCMCLYVCNI
jgi:hypothetical protein